MNFKDLKADLKGIPAARIVFVGLGNSFRCDDAAGLIVTEHIAHRAAFQKAHFILAYTTPENHLQEILDCQPRLVVFIDAADWGGKPGESSWITHDQIEKLAISTHSYSIVLIEKYLVMNGIKDVRYLVIQPAFKDWKKEIGIHELR